MECAQGGGPVDLPGQMSLLALMFGNHAGVPPAAAVVTADDLVACLQQAVPAATPPGEEPPALEAAAYAGEWLRSYVGATWVAEENLEPHLQLGDATGAIVYLVPLPNLLRRAIAAGYDGMSTLFDDILDDVTDPPQACRLDELRIAPEPEPREALAWLRSVQATEGEAWGALWRRCATCARTTMDAVHVPLPKAGAANAPPGAAARRPTVEETASAAADVLADRPFACPCGGVPGQMRRFLLVHPGGEGVTATDIGIAATHTRVSCWRIQGDFGYPTHAAILASST